MQEEKDYFPIPHMCLHRDDIINLFEGNDDNNDIEKINNLTDDEMKSIADQLHILLMDDWDLCLKIAYNDHIQKKEVRE